MNRLIAAAPGLASRLRALPPLVLAIGALTLTLAPAAAQTPPAPQGAQPPALGFAALTQTPLTAERIAGLIGSFPEVRTAAEAMKSKYKVPAAGAGAESFAAYLGVAGAVGELNGVVRKYGFKDFNDWLGVLLATSSAVVYASRAPDVGVTQAIAAIQNNPNMSDEQKQRLVAQMQAQGSLVPKPPQQNIDLVKPFVPELRTLFK